MNVYGREMAQQPVFPTLDTYITDEMKLVLGIMQHTYMIDPISFCGQIWVQIKWQSTFYSCVHFWVNIYTRCINEGLCCEEF